MLDQWSTLLTPPAAIGPYSHAAAPSGHHALYLSGQTPIDPATGLLIDGDVGVQTRQVFANLEAVLQSAGGSLADVVKINVYLTSMTDFVAMNEAYAQVLQEPFPARTTVPSQDYRLAPGSRSRS